MHKETFLGCRPNVYLSFYMYCLWRSYKQVAKASVFEKKPDFYILYNLCCKWFYNAYLVKQAAFF